MESDALRFSIRGKIDEPSIGKAVQFQSWDISIRKVKQIWERKHLMSLTYLNVGNLQLLNQLREYYLTPLRHL